MIEAYARLPKLVESAHLPVQSGSDRVLKLMHRGYTRERFLGIIEKLRRAQPDIGITTDIIVGFPGETEDDFEQTLSLAREVEFDNAYIFKYSQRRDTPAAEMPGPGAAKNPRGTQPAPARNRSTKSPNANTMRSSGGRRRFSSKGRAKRIRRG